MRSRWLKDVLEVLGTPRCRPRLLDTTWRLTRVIDEIVDSLDEESAEALKDQIREARVLLERLGDELEAVASAIPAEVPAA